MTPLLLIKTLAEELREELKEFELSAQYQSDRKVKVYAQHFSLADFENDTFYPQVLIQLKSLEDDGINSVATVIFSIGVYGEDHERWWIDLFNIAERVRQYILTHAVIAERFPLMLPLAFEPLDGQPFEPFFFGNIAARYRIATPRVSVDW